MKNYISGRGFLNLPQKGISIKTGRLSNAVGAQCRFIIEGLRLYYGKDHGKAYRLSMGVEWTKAGGLF